MTQTPQTPEPEYEISRFMSAVAEQRVKANRRFLDQYFQQDSVPLSELDNETMQSIIYSYRSNLSDWQMCADKAEARNELTEAEHEKTALELRKSEGYLAGTPVDRDEYESELERIQQRIDAAQKEVLSLGTISALRDSE